MYGLTKMAGCWPSSFFARLQQGQYPAILCEQAGSKKDLFSGETILFSLDTQRAIPSGEDSAILAPSWLLRLADFCSCTMSQPDLVPVNSLNSFLVREVWL